MIIDPKSSVPIFLQIASQLRQRITAGVFLPGESLPSVRRLARDLLVNHNTIQKAYDELAREGVVESRRGAGLFVVHRSMDEASGEAEERLAQQLGQAIGEALSAELSPQRIRALFRDALQSQVDLASRRAL